MRGASALQDLLAEFPEAELRVQIVWEPVLLSDIAPPRTGVLGRISDPRVTQYWDPGRVLSADLVRAVNTNPARYRLDEPLPSGFIAWDVVSVYGRAARWDGDPPVPLHYDGPVVEAIDATREAIRSALALPVPDSR